MMDRPRNKRRLGPSVFLAYSRADQEIVREFYRLLRLDGFQIWFDEVNLIAGQDWQLEIEAAVRRAEAVVVFLSRRSVDGRGYVHKELALALDTAEREPEASIFIIPIRLDGVVVPSRLQHLHWLERHDHSGGIGGTYRHLQRALIARANQLGNIHLPAPSEAPPDSPHMSDRTKEGLREGLFGKSDKGQYFASMRRLIVMWQGGSYLVHGRNPSGETYVGTAALKIQGDSALLEAKIRAHVLKYSGRYDGELLSLSGAHVVTYDTRSPDGVLQGSWGEGGFEELIPASPFAEVWHIGEETSNTRRSSGRKPQKARFRRSSA